MQLDRQPALLEIPEQPVEEKAPPVPAPAKLKPIDRRQGLLRAVIVEELVGPDHKARAIWDLSGELELSGFQAGILSREGKVGRAAWDPRLLLSVWLYAYSEQVTSAREIERLMEYEPGLMWLSGLGEVNHHTLSDFRADHPEELKQLLAELLGLLSREGFVKLECVAHDGTKIRAQAGSDSFRRAATLEKEIARARQRVEELDRQAESEQTEGERRQAARQRVARERSERMQRAAEQLQQIRAGKSSEPERQQARVSLSEPEARIMKHGDHALAPSYNVQISTDVENKIVVGMQVTQCSSDSGSLPPAMEQVRETMGRYPKQAVADGGFTNRASIEAMQERGIDFYGSLPALEVKQAAALKAAGIDSAFAPSCFPIQAADKTLRCPAGKTLTYVRQCQKRQDTTYHQYRAQASDCRSCQFQKQCCPEHAGKGRMVSIRISGNPDVAAFREKMKNEDAQRIYKKRGAAAEFPNSWLKEKLGMRKFRLRGLAKATAEAVWGVLTYDVMQWLRLSWRPKLAVRIAA